MFDLRFLFRQSCYTFRRKKKSSGDKCSHTKKKKKEGACLFLFFGFIYI